MSGEAEGHDRIVINGRELELNEVDLPDDAVLVDAFVIFRVQQPDQKFASVYYTQNDGMSDEEQLGAQLMVLDRCRRGVLKNWID